MKSFIILSLLASTTFVFGQPPPTRACRLGRPAQFDAGKSLITEVIGARINECTAVVVPEEPKVLQQFVYFFNTSRCEGSSLGRFLIPLGAPNGGAFVIW